MPSRKTIFNLGICLGVASLLIVPVTAQSEIYNDDGSANGWLAQPLGNLSQPPLMADQPPAFATASAAAVGPAAADEQPAVVIEAQPASVPSDLTEPQPNLNSVAAQPPPNYRPPAPPPSSKPSVLLAQQEPITLATRSGLDAGAQLAYYRYSAPTGGTTEDANSPFLGLNMSGTYAFGPGFFIRGEGRYAFTHIDYKSAGDSEINDRRVDTWEWRALAGRDFLFQQFDLTPYAGFGYRTLYNDNRGIMTDGSIGYQRFNDLYYIPVGIEPRARIDTDARLSAKVEYDAVLHGMQQSNLGDEGFGDPTIRNRQPTGFGLRGELMYETRSWSFGPYFNYWNISQSVEKDELDYSSISCSGLGVPCLISGTEPSQHTIEAGIQFIYHFLDF